MKEKQIILNGNSIDLLKYLKKKLVVENYEQSTTYGFDFDYGKGYLTVFEKYFFRNESVATLTLHIHPLENEQVELIAVISGSSAGILKVDWGVSKAIMKTLDRLIEDFK